MHRELMDGVNQW